MSALRLGAVAFDRRRLAPEIATLLERTMHPSADAVGEWTFCDLWSGPRWAGPPEPADRDIVRAALPYLVECVDDAFDTSRLAIARIFSVRRRGFIRPHRDWIAKPPAFTRLHVPLQTDATCINTEDGIAYHMRLGEIWYVDGSCMHAGACLSDTTRLHLVIDFDPRVPPVGLVRRAAAATPAPPRPLPRIDVDAPRRAAIEALSNLANGATFSPIADLLCALHFEYDVHAADAYRWLEDLTARAVDPRSARRATELRERYAGIGATTERAAS